MSSSPSKNHYALHLTSLGENREVIASEDIVNEQGVLLVKKGAPINKKISDQIVKFKLFKPIENSVNVSGSIDSEKILADLHRAFQKDPDLQKINESLQLDPLLLRLSKTLDRYPILVQKLTVMSAQLPKLYIQTIIVSWLSTAIGKQLNMSAPELECTFLAAIAHDIGMLHISPDVIFKNEALTSEEWRQIQSHTVIGQKILENIPELDKKIAKIVLEHHERCDGTGYPLGKFAEGLSIESQIIALADSVTSVYSNKLAPNEKKIRDLIPFLQVNSESHFYPTYAAIMQIIRCIDLEETCFISKENINTEIKSVLEKNKAVTNQLKCLEALLYSDLLENKHKLITSAASIIEQIVKFVRGSGVLDDGYLRWLELVQTETLEHAFREIADVSLMLSELEWQLSRATKILNSFIHLNPESEQDLKATIKDHIARMQEPTKKDEYAI